jgi:PAS domain S-box-containing protein
MSILELFEETSRNLDRIQPRFPLKEGQAAPGTEGAAPDESGDGLVRPREVEELLLDINRAITTTKPLDDVIRLVLDGIIQLTGTDRGFLMLKVGPRGRLKFTVARDKHKQTLAGEEFNISQGFVQKTLRSREILYMDDALRDQRFKMHESIYHLALRTIICAPLRLGERTIGVIYADSQKRVNTFSERKLDLLRLFASQAAVAIENARLYRESQHSEAKYRTLVESAADIILSVDPKGRVVYVNPALEQILGLGVEELGSLCGKLSWVHSDDKTRLRSCFRDALEGRPARDVEFRGIHSDGTTRWLALSLQPLYNGQAKKLCGVQGIIRDVTTQREIYLKMSQSEKLRALGELAGGVAHDFNNILGVMIPRLEMITSRLGDEKNLRDIDTITRAARDGEKIVNRIRNFTRTEQLTDDLTEVDLNQIASESVEMTRPMWGRAGDARSPVMLYTLKTDLRADGRLHGCESELREMFTNIIFNAVDAMPHGGIIRIRSWNAGDRLFCTISDSGEGMSEEVQKCVFNPFFTTKGKRGTGLGLSVVYGIVTRHRGEIEVKSSPGRGTEFTISLPRLPDPQLDANPPTGTAEALEPRQKILIVDDELGVREVLTEILREFGFSVTAAENGQRALRCLEQEAFGVVFTDLDIPGMSGLDLSREIKSRYPEIKVLLFTGWRMEKDDTRLRQSGVDLVLPKPIVMDQIRTALSQLTGRTI